MKLTIPPSLLFITVILSCSRLWAAPLDTNHIDQITGLKGTWNAAEGVFKVSQPRSEVPAKVKEIRTANAQPAKSFGGGVLEKNAITAAPLADLFTAKPQENDGMVKFVFGRVARMECGCDVGKEMGVNTWASFGGTDENAV